MTRDKGRTAWQVVRLGPDGNKTPYGKPSKDYTTIVLLAEHLNNGLIKAG